jgi:cellulose synthase/poly-beta-1,6-N-acetylglucosamine synthase-like glycosyltransferase
MTSMRLNWANEKRDKTETDLPSVSVIIPVYNGEADLPDLLQCLQRQTYPPDRVEFILVDNGSRDRTSEILHQFQTQPISFHHHPHAFTFRWCSETKVQSAYAARNTGIRAAKGEILGFTDADCRPQPDWLLQLIQPFRQPSVGIVAGEIQALPGQSRLEKYAEQQQTLAAKHTLAHPFCPYGQTANLAVRQQILQQIGLFRPYLTTGGDADLCWRILRSTSWTIAFAETAVVHHRHRSTWTELYRQWHRYGCSHRYLHQLHGIELAPVPTRRDYFYRWSRWLLKEIPTALAQLGTPPPQTSLFNVMMDTPIDLFCMRARAIGQQQATLTEQARQIEWLQKDRSEPGNLGRRIGGLT